MSDGCDLPKTILDYADEGIKTFARGGDVGFGADLVPERGRDFRRRSRCDGLGVVPWR